MTPPTLRLTHPTQTLAEASTYTPGIPQDPPFPPSLGQRKKKKKTGNACALFSLPLTRSLTQTLGLLPLLLLWHHSYLSQKYDSQISLLPSESSHISSSYCGTVCRCVSRKSWCISSYCVCVCTRALACVCVWDRERFMMNWVSPNPSVPGWAWNGSSCFRVRRWRRASGMWGWPACVFHPPHFAATPLPHATFLKFLSRNKKSILGRIRASGISAVQVVLNILECITTHKKCSCIVRSTHC